MSGDSIGARLLARAGYKGSGGLGKNEHGEVVPVSDQYVSREVGARTGIGYSLTSKSVLQPMQWLFGPSIRVPSETDSDTLAQDHNRIAAEYRAKVEIAKTRLETLSPSQLRNGRKAADAARMLDKEFFQNRAALKIAEIDAMSGFLLTGPPMDCPSDCETWHVLDICGGPGGFTEYFGTRLGWRAALHGITLRNCSNDWALHKCNPGAQLQTFRSYYGPDGSGDITVHENALAIALDIVNSVGPAGVQVVVADGGFDVSGREANQERLSVPLLAAQCLIAMHVLARGGHFVCKLFDTFEGATQRILWILSLCFEAVAICKPLLSRTANSERYVVCRSFARADRSGADWSMLDRLLARALVSTTDFESDMQLTSIFNRDTSFQRYLHRSITQVAESQLSALDHFRRNHAVPAIARDEFLRAIDLRQPERQRVTNERGVCDPALSDAIQREFEGISAWQKDDDDHSVSLELPNVDVRSLKLVAMWFHSADCMGDYDIQFKRFRRYQAPASYAYRCAPGSVVTAFTWEGKLLCYDAWALPGVPQTHSLPLRDRQALLRLWVSGCNNASVCFLNINADKTRASLLLTTGPRPSRLRAVLSS